MEGIDEKKEKETRNKRMEIEKKCIDIKTKTKRKDIYIKKKKWADTFMSIK
jgi:translation initiation factor IF-3